MDDEIQLPAAIDIGYSSGLKISRVSIRNSPVGVRLGHAINPQIQNVNIKNDKSVDFTELITAVHALNDQRAMSALNKVTKDPQNVNAWKTLIKKVGNPAISIAIAVAANEATKAMDNLIKWIAAHH